MITTARRDDFDFLEMSCSEQRKEAFTSTTIYPRKLLTHRFLLRLKPLGAFKETLNETVVHFWLFPPPPKKN